MSEDVWVLEDDTADDGIIRKYPIEKPYTVRDQGIRGADDMVYTVLSDIHDVLAGEFAAIEAQAKAYSDALNTIEDLMNEADELPWDEHHNWIDVGEDPNGPEKLADMLQQAEQLDPIYVDWNGDAGTVTVSLAEYWREFSA